MVSLYTIWESQLSFPVRFGVNVQEPSEISVPACSRHSKSSLWPRASLSDYVRIHLGLLSILYDVYYHLRLCSSLTIWPKVQIARISLYLSRYYNRSTEPIEILSTRAFGSYLWDTVYQSGNTFSLGAEESESQIIHLPVHSFLSGFIDTKQ